MKKKLLILLVIKMSIVMGMVAPLYPSDIKSGSIYRLDDHTSFAKAITSIGGTPVTLIINSPKIVDTNIIVPSTISLSFKTGGKLVRSGAAQVTIKGPIDAELFQIFEDTSKERTNFIVFDSGSVERVYPHWWGAKGDEVTDDTLALQRSIDAMQLNGGTISLPPGTYLYGNLTCYSNMRFVSAGNAVLKPKAGSSGFAVGGLTNITFENLTFDCSLQVGGGASAIRGRSTTTNLTIINCEFKSGCYGVMVKDVVNLKILNCKGHNFSHWALYIQGGTGVSITHGKWYNNIDGIKLAGIDKPAPKNTLKDIFIISNECYGNERDGIDIAGNNMENIHVNENILRNNKLNGFEMKTAYQTDYVRNIEVVNNRIMDNGPGYPGLDFLFFRDLVRADHVLCKGNMIYMNSNAGGRGIGCTGLSEASEVSDNYIEGYAYGIRTFGSEKLRIHRNKIVGSKTAIHMTVAYFPNSDGNIIEENDLQSTSNGVQIADPAVTNTIIRSNKVNPNIAANQVVVDGGIGTKAYNNSRGHSAPGPRR